MRLFKGFGTNVGQGGGKDLVDVTVTTRGLNAHRKAAKKVQYAVRRGGVKGLRRALKYWLREAKKVTPKDKGGLRRSGSVEILMEDPPKGRIVFGAPYAVYVHEDLEAQHAPGTYAKYLERTMKNRRHLSVGRGMIAQDITAAEMRVLR